VKRLWVRLTLAFGVVILVTVASVALLSSLNAGREFRMYMTSSNQMSQQGLVSGLAEYYRLQGSWDGIGTILDQMMQQPRMMGGMGRGNGPGGMMTSSLQLILADGSASVIYDSSAGSLGRRLSREEQAAAQDVVIGDQTVGLLVMTVPVGNEMMGPLEQSFLARLQRLLVIGALLAGALGLLLGLAFSQSLAAPLRRLAAAARAVARRDFSQRVPTGGSVEMDEVAHAFNEMAAGLEQAERQRQNLVADVAHELRTPISVLQGNLRAILDDVYALDKAEISRLYDETRLISRLVDDLGELARADAGQLSLNVQRVDAAQIAQATVESLAPAAEAEGVTLDLVSTGAGALPAVRADPDRLAQVLRNLLINALRHTPEGGTVEVRISPPAADGFVKIAVADTGEGIAPDDLPHVFDRFWRADRSRSRDGRSPGGSGLGLSIAKSLVEAQGGSIWAESCPGLGSTFYLTLPLDRA